MNSNTDLQMRLAEPLESLASPVALRRQVESARALRSDVTAALFATSFRALARPLRAPVAGAARWWRRRATVAALMRCNDRVLADIGIERERIPLIARGHDPSRQPAEARPAWQRWPAMLAHVDVPAMIRRGTGHAWPRFHPSAQADRA